MNIRETNTDWLECSECNEKFEVSNPIAEAMHHWREEDPAKPLSLC